VSLRIIQVSDIHFGGENRIATEAALVQFASLEPDLLIIAGDLTRDGATPEFDAAQAWLGRVQQPQLIVPGNHDTPYLGPGEILERLLHPWRRYKSRFGVEDDAVWTRADAAAFTLNTARGAQLRWNWSKGAVSGAQVIRLRQRLQSVAATAVRIVVCHHPLIEITGGPMTARVRGGTLAAETLVEARADLVLSGHIHTPFVAAYPFGDGKTVAVGSGTLSVRERGAPPSFNLIEVEGADIRVTAFALERTRFQVWRSWAFERRPGTGA